MTRKPDEKFNLILPVLLTDKELKSKAHQLATLIRLGEDLTAEQKLSNDGFKTKLKEMDAHVKEFAEVVRTGKVPRDVECTMEVDVPEMTATVVRLDTGEIVETRPATKDELTHASQRSMFGGQGETS